MNEWDVFVCALTALSVVCAFYISGRNASLQQQLRAMTLSKNLLRRELDTLRSRIRRAGEELNPQVKKKFWSYGPRPVCTESDFAEITSPEAGLKGRQRE